MTDRARKVRVGVVGIGYFGRFHALKFAAHPRALLVAIADHHVARLVDVAAECAACAFTSHEDLFGAVEAVSIATPADTHAALAREFLSQGIHVLVEKPMATSLAEADSLIALARRKDLVLQVGHQERAVLAAAGLFDTPQRPASISCIRKGPFTGRNLDVDVVLDLMTHDLDLVHALDPSAIAALAAKGDAVRSSQTDWADVDLTLADGCRVSCHASRVHDGRERSMEIVYPDGRVSIDFLARSVENTTPRPLRDLFSEADGGITSDPLGFALDRFIRAVLGEASPLVSGADARFTLDAAEQIQAVLRKS